MTKMYRMPEKRGTYGDVIAQVRELKSKMTPGERGRLSSTAFHGQGETQQLVTDALVEFMHWNGLFSYEQAAAAKMEDDVLDICIALVGSGEAGRGNLTSGGTESIFCGLQAMRGWARKHKPEIKTPEIIAPFSAHATFLKQSKYLDIKVIGIPQRDDLSADTGAMIAAIGPNTIGFYASAPNWPYGQVDPITELGRVAEERGLWLHVDACVGGYILPFMRELGENIPAYDFSVPGVRSISADLHKYGYAPKPCSTILWRSQQEQAFHYTSVSEWPCGLYISQSMIGSRSMGPVAGAWALMHYWGHEGYLDNTRRILEIKKAIVDKCASIEGLRTWESHGPLLMIESEGFDIQLVVGGMAARDWPLLGVNDPPAIHLTLDAISEDSLQQLLQDLEEVCADVRAGKLTTEGLLSYGGVGDGRRVPKWLISAVEIMQGKHE